MTTTASRPSSTARIGSHCPAWKSTCPKRSARIARARVFDTAFGMKAKLGRKHTPGRESREAVDGRATVMGLQDDARHRGDTATHPTRHALRLVAPPRRSVSPPL